jgi:membrane protease YdiL (CAAX protease family)
MISTAVTAVDRRGARLSSVAALALGTALLAARPALVADSARPFLLLGALFVALLIAGTRLPVPVTPTLAPAPVRLAALGIGTAGFAVARIAAGGTTPFGPTLLLVAANTLAAVAEEAWFRRLCFGLLEPGGTGFAVGGSAVLFALVHLAIYGPWVLPLDLAAGMILGWQRAVTGSWRVPALTHAFANVLVVI